MGFSELVLLAIIALIFIGPRQLPEVAKTVARALNELRRATGDIAGSFREVSEKANQEIRQSHQSLHDPVPAQDVSAGSGEKRRDGSAQQRQTMDAEFEEVTDTGVNKEAQQFIESEVTTINFDPSISKVDKPKG